MRDKESISTVIRFVFCLLILALSGCAGVSWLSPNEDAGVKVQVLQTMNLSSKVADIGGLPRSVHIRGISGDGSVIVGKFRSNQPPYEWQIFRYSTSTGIENLRTLGKAKDSIEATCVSADGIAIWGTFYVTNEGSHIFRYTRENGLEDLGTLGRDSIEIKGVSTDGSVIAGSFLATRLPRPGKHPPFHAFRYDRSHGFEDLGAMGAESAFARGISDDGSLIVGNFQLEDTSSHAFLYSQPNGVQDLGVGGIGAFAIGLSGDGSVILGTYYGEFSFSNYKYYDHLFIYTKAGGVTKLGAMGGKSVEATRISADGTKIFGSYIGSDSEAYVYTAKIVQPIAQR